MKISAVLQHTRDGAYLEFPQLPGVTAVVEPGQVPRDVARETLHAYFESMLVRGELPVPPNPLRGGRQKNRIDVSLSAEHAVSLQMRWLRLEQRLTLSEVAARMGVSRQRISALETSTRNWTLATLQRVGEALDADLHISLRRRK